MIGRLKYQLTSESSTDQAKDDLRWTVEHLGHHFRCPHDDFDRHLPRHSLYHVPQELRMSATSNPTPFLYITTSVPLLKICEYRTLNWLIINVRWFYCANFFSLYFFVFWSKEYISRYVWMNASSLVCIFNIINEKNAYICSNTHTKSLLRPIYLLHSSLPGTTPQIYP